MCDPSGTGGFGLNKMLAKKGAFNDTEKKTAQAPSPPSQAPSVSQQPVNFGKNNGLTAAQALPAAGTPPTPIPPATVNPPASEQPVSGVKKRAPLSSEHAPAQAGARENSPLAGSSGLASGQLLQHPAFAKKKTRTDTALPKQPTQPTQPTRPTPYIQLAQGPGGGDAPLNLSYGNNRDPQAGVQLAYLPPGWSQAGQEAKNRIERQQHMDFYRSCGQRRANAVHRMYEMLKNGSAGQEEAFAALFAELKSATEEMNSYHTPSHAGTTAAREAYRQERSRLKPTMEHLTDNILKALGAFAGPDGFPGGWDGFPAAKQSTELFETFNRVMEEVLFTCAEQGKPLSFQQLERLSIGFALLNTIPVGNHSALGPPEYVGKFVRELAKDERRWNEVLAIVDGSDDYAVKLAKWFYGL